MSFKFSLNLLVWLSSIISEKGKVFFQQQRLLQLALVNKHSSILLIWKVVKSVSKISRIFLQPTFPEHHHSSVVRMLGVSHQTLNNLRWNGSDHMSLFIVFISQTLSKSLWTSRSVRILEVLFDISCNLSLQIHPSSKVRNVCQFPHFLLFTPRCPPSTLP